MTALLSLSLPLLEADPAEEGRHVITGMLLVGLVFIAVIALGETSRYLKHRRQARRRPSY
ncbi:MAG: hypothetical protein ABR583_07295 [Gaiellaceae bacterium]